MILETMILYSVGGVVGAASAIYLYRKATRYHRQLNQLEALKNESERAQALGLEQSMQDDDGLLYIVRKNEVKALADAILHDPVIQDDTQSGCRLLAEHHQKYPCLFSFEIALMKTIIEESSYFYRNKTHEACCQLILNNPRYNLCGVDYYIHFSNQLGQQAQMSKTYPSQDLITMQDSIQEKEDSIKSLNQEIIDANQRYEKLNQQLNESMTQNKQLNSFLVNEKERHRETQNKFHQCQTQLAQTQAQMVKLTRQIQMLEKQLSDKEEQLSQLKELVQASCQKAENAEQQCQQLASYLEERKRNEVMLEARLSRLETQDSQPSNSLSRLATWVK